MRIQLASDLHLELLGQRFTCERLIAPVAGADLLVLAGDVSVGTRGIELFADWPVPVLYVPGNHEFYGLSWEQTRADMRQAARGTNVVLLDNDIADLGSFGSWSSTRATELSKLRFLGTTLWTDYRLQAGFTQRQMMAAAESAISDHFRIRTQQGSFRAAQALDDHQMSRNWLDRELSRTFDGKTVVITHHGPHSNSVHPRWLAPATLALNGAFVSNLPELLAKADVWLHGHVHDSFSYAVEGCRVVTNPLGYARDVRRAPDSSKLEFENTNFRWDFILDI